MKILWLFLAFLYAKNVESNKIEHRLPKNISPTEYKLEILTELQEPNFSFSGTVSIKVKCLTPTNSIVLHSKDLIIKDKEVTVKEIVSKDKLTPIPVTSVTLKNDVDFLNINVGQNLKKGAMYLIHIPFSRALPTDMEGYYRCSYVEKKTKATKWLAVTQLGPTFARRAFPCFDEPEMKAKFTIRLAHKSNLKAISNMPLSKTTPYNGKNGYVWSEFKESVPMSTYLVAFLISDFQNSGGSNKFKLWSRKDVLPQTKFAKFMAPKILQFYENYFGMKFPLPEIDMAAIPCFGTGAMENWGLITYSEGLLLYDPKTTPKATQQKVAEVIAHELSHQWFGNLVTMKWWTDLWLNEGFAMYIGAWGIEQLYPKWKYLEDFVLTQIVYIYEQDSVETSHPVSNEIGHPDEIGQMFDDISYFKGSLIVRMMHLFLGRSFQTGLTKYLKKHQYANADQNALWAALTEQVHADGTLDKSLTVKEVMDTWTLQTGYPLVTVTRDYAKGTAKLTQKIYLRVKPKGQVKDTCWWIPVTYTTQDRPDFKNTSPKLWMNSKNRETAELTKLNPKSWLLLNINIAGIYRVNYDDQNWKLLTDALNSNRFSEISIMNRADLLMNAFDLAWTGELNYKQPFTLAKYLVREKEWLPWKVASEKLRRINKLLRRTSSYPDFKNFMLKIIGPIYNKYNRLTVIPNEVDQIQLHGTVSTWAIDLGIESAVKQTQDLFAKWMKTRDPDNNNPIPKDLRDFFYCRVMSVTGAESWEFMLKRYQSPNVGSEKPLILGALSCSIDVAILNRLLDMTFKENSPIKKEDSTSVFTVTAAGSFGRPVACEFLQKRIKDILKYHSNNSATVGSYAAACAEGMVNQDELTKFKNFVAANKDSLKDGQATVDAAIGKAQANIDWYNKNINTITSTLKALK